MNKQTNKQTSKVGHAVGDKQTKRYQQWETKGDK